MAKFVNETEKVIMLGILRKHPNAYGVSVYDELKEKLGREVPVATIYATLDKLIDKGFVKSRQGEATAERGGRAKIYFELTGKGQTALNASLAGLDRLRAGTKFGEVLA